MMIYDDKQFEQPVATLLAFDAAGVRSALAEMEKWRQTHYLVGYLRYEAKAVFLGQEIQSELPLLYFQVFEQWTPYVSQHTTKFNLKAQAQQTFEAYAAAIKQIKAEQRQGNTYEVNYTYDYTVPFDGDELALYEYLLTKQRTPYNTWIKNDYETVLSFSPELFFEVDQQHITTRPMKGTVKRGQTATEDEALIRFLQTDEKNRAENVMIVDLMRNDLGRIAQNGSVKVTRLFDVETHETVHQMTSQIEADLKAGTSLYELLAALFPNGSVTGAPKLSTMQIIEAVETGSRDIYCGAIGFLSPQEMIFSVPIRILQRQSGQPDFKYRVGGAIVWDSETADEWLETLNKTAFLQEELQLIETMQVENGEISFKAAHFARLQRSADYYGFQFNPAILKLKPEQDGMLRLVLDRDGHFETSYRKRQAFDTVSLSPVIVSSGADFLAHKTTYRPYFRAKDELFCNERGELTEMSRANLILECNGEWLTPPLSSGLLPGIYRQHLLDTGQCREQVLYRDDLYRADKLFCCNSVQGMREVKLL
ncbi:MAG: aminodeoxychorismate synthase component I [Streptococcaceae bacterium]|jgi:para-aminobenzoate synthetase/4-amino-4-deoxychorismate lyase|nr:aminodeoxychorismate synthase component I [Streptococcaceae bacterium]